MRKRLLIGAVAVVVVASGVGIWRWMRPVKTEKDRLTLYGNVEIRDAQLAFREEEIVSEVAVEEGDSVVPGQVLARLRRGLLEDQLAEAEARYRAQAEVLRRLENGTRRQELRQAQAEVEAAKVRAENALLTLRRIENTTRIGTSSEQALEDARARLEEERAQLAVRREALDLAREGPRAEDVAEARALLEADRSRIGFLRNRLKDTVLEAPVAGIIQSRILEPGEMAGPTKPAFILALTDPKWIRAYVPEPDLGLIREGMHALARSDSWPDRDFPGRIGFISSEAEFTPKSVETTDLRTKLVYEVRVFVHDPEHRLRLRIGTRYGVAHNDQIGGWVETVRVETREDLDTDFRQVRAHRRINVRIGAGHTVTA